MKWKSRKRERYSRCLTGISGKKNGNSFLINDHTTSDYTFTHLGWYIIVENIKKDKIFNSLWQNLWFKELEEAKLWCENFEWEYVTNSSV